MDAINTVEKEVDEVLRLFSNYKDVCSMEIDNVIEFVENSRAELNNLANHIMYLSSSTEDQTDLDGQQLQIIQRVCDKIQKLCTQMTKSHKDLHSPVCAIGKVIEKNFISKFSLWTPESQRQFIQSPENLRLLNLAIVQHLLRNGMSEVTDQFIKESNLQIEDKEINKFDEIAQILTSIRNGDHGPALKWAIKNRQRLREMNSPLEFKIHKAHIIELYKQGIEKQLEIIRYARENFQHFDNQFDKEIEHLMGGIVYLRSGIEKSPYKSLLEPLTIQELENIFVSNACSLLALSKKSSIATAIEAGSIALPKLLDINQKLEQQKMRTVCPRDELPVEVDLGRSLQFHSIVSCPILKQQCTESNPPMRLVCGHLISQEALKRLPSSGSAKLKCPYCPQEQQQSDALQVRF